MRRVAQRRDLAACGIEVLGDERADFGLAIGWPTKVIDVFDLPGNHADLASRHPFGPIAPGAGDTEFADRGHIGLARPQDPGGILLYGLARKGAEVDRVPTSGGIARKLQEVCGAGTLPFKLADEGKDRERPSGCTGSSMQSARWHSTPACGQVPGRRRPPWSSSQPRA